MTEAVEQTRYLNVQEAADFLRLSPSTLNNQRVKGDGPPFSKFGRRVVYDQADLIAWAEARRVFNSQQARR